VIPQTSATSTSPEISEEPDVTKKEVPKSVKKPGKIPETFKKFSKGESSSSTTPRPENVPVPEDNSESEEATAKFRRVPVRTFKKENVQKKGDSSHESESWMDLAEERKKRGIR
jgi:hypothetical protein